MDDSERIYRLEVALLVLLRITPRGSHIAYYEAAKKVLDDEETEEDLRLLEEHR